MKYLINIYNSIFFIPLAILFFLFLNSCNQKINKSISIEYQLLKEDTCNYFCYKNVITIINNTNNSLYFFEPDIYQKNKFGILLPKFWSTYHYEGNYFKQYAKFFFDSTSADFLNRNTLMKDSNEIVMIKNKQGFKNSLFIYYQKDFMLLNNISELSKTDSNFVKSKVDNAVPYYMVLLNANDTLILTRNANVLVTQVSQVNLSRRIL